MMRRITLPLSVTKGNKIRSAGYPVAPDMSFPPLGVRSAGYALSSVRRPGGFAIRRQKMT